MVPDADAEPFLRNLLLLISRTILIVRKRANWAVIFGTFHLF